MEQLIKLAEKSEPIRLEPSESNSDIELKEFLQLDELGGAFKWLMNEPDLYGIDDLKTRYE